MPFPKVCAYKPCSKSFVSVTNAKQFCSESCMRLARRTRLVKQCANPACRQAFIAHRPPAKYCSAACMGVMRKRSPHALKKYLMERIEMPKNSEGCWFWKGVINDQGYGLAYKNYGQARAHRLVYETFIGPIPQEMDLLHGSTCTTRACVNPFHLHIGTNMDNIEDRKVFGNHLQGSLMHNAIFDEQTVLHILKEFHEQGKSIVMIAKTRKANVATVRCIIYRQTWKHVAPGLYPSPPHGLPGRHVPPRMLMNMPHAVCGGVYCCRCGECLSCYGEDPCYACEDRHHVIP